jgi:hypothetical protein
MKVLLIITTVFLLVSCTQPEIDSTLITRCVITDVKHYSIGERHSLQTSPEWKITTSCNTRHTFHHKVSVGDTLLIKKIHYKNKFNL